MAMVSGWLRLSLVASNIKVTRVYNKEGDANASPSLLYTLNNNKNYFSIIIFLEAICLPSMINAYV